MKMKPDDRVELAVLRILYWHKLLLEGDVVCSKCLKTRPGHEFMNYCDGKWRVNCKSCRNKASAQNYIRRGGTDKGKVVELEWKVKRMRLVRDELLRRPGGRKIVNICFDQEA